MNTGVKIRSKYLASFTLLSIVIQMYIYYFDRVLINEITIGIGFAISICLAISSVIPDYESYSEIYSKAPLYNPTINQFGILIALVILFNSASSGFVAYWVQGDVIAGILGSIKWIFIHGIAAASIMGMTILTVHRIIDESISKSRFILLCLFSALLAGSIFTPSGTLGWYIRESYDDVLIAFIIKSAIVVPAMAILVSLLSHIFFLSISKSINLSKVFHSLEMIIASITLFAMASIFISLIGNSNEEMKSISLMLLFVQFFLFFIAVYRIVFYLNNHSISRRDKDTPSPHVQ